MNPFFRPCRLDVRPEEMQTLTPRLTHRAWRYPGAKSEDRRVTGSWHRT
ncbi:MAG: hypothetical protein V3R69_07590 [candidate division NC10 bacterium]